MLFRSCRDIRINNLSTEVEPIYMKLGKISEWEFHGCLIVNILEIISDHNNEINLKNIFRCNLRKRIIKFWCL
jgi:hypothetical protein